MRFYKFQSSPSLDAGRYEKHIHLSFASLGFNPRPAWMLGATVQLQLDDTTEKIFVNARTGQQVENLSTQIKAYFIKFY